MSKIRVYCDTCGHDYTYRLAEFNDGKDDFFAAVMLQSSWCYQGSCIAGALTFDYHGGTGLDQILDLIKPAS